MSDISVWNESNLRDRAYHRHFPSEILMRSIFSSSYFSAVKFREDKKAVLDVGSLYANNLVPFHDRGWQCNGVEVTSDSVEICRECAHGWGIEANIHLGFNDALPFESASMDLVLSLSTIHYEESSQAVERSLREFKRVLRSDGYCLVQTAAPEASIFRKSRQLDDGLYLLEDTSDIRNGQKFYFFDNEFKFAETLKGVFSSVQIARSTEYFPNQVVDIWLGLCKC